jgi:hypothetical protein
MPESQSSIFLNKYGERRALAGKAWNADQQAWQGTRLGKTGHSPLIESPFRLLYNELSILTTIILFMGE